MGYFAQLDNLQNILSQILKVTTIKPSTYAGLAFIDIKVEFLYGIPYATSASGTTTLDVDRMISATTSTSGKKDDVVAYVRSSGFIGSALEAAVFEQLWNQLNIKGISATKVLQIANENDIPIYRVTKTNISQILPHLQITTAVKNDIINAINAGKEVTIPERDVVEGDWKGIGYIVEDPGTGAAGYLISGGLAGGSITQLIIELVGGAIASLIAKKWTTTGRAFGIGLAVISYLSNLITIIITPNLNALERAVLALVAGVAMIAAAVAIIYVGSLLLAILLGILISLIAYFFFNYLLSKFTEALLDFFRILFIFAKNGVQSKNALNLATFGWKSQCGVCFV